MLDIVNLTVEKAFNLLIMNKLSSSLILSHCISQIEKYDNDFGVFLFVNKSDALLCAQNSDYRYLIKQPRSILEGIPIAIKDNIITKDIPTTAASRILKNYKSPFDATAITRLKNLGAIIIGKVNCDEFAMGSSTENSFYQITKNSFNKTKSPGGSSGGSAVAVSLGMCLIALGSDTGGSVRQPASFCGLIGFKPTYGRISRYGLIAFSNSMDQIGIFSKNAIDTLIVLSFLFGYDDFDHTSALLNFNLSGLIYNIKKPIRIGVPNDLMLTSIGNNIKNNIIYLFNNFEQNKFDFSKIFLPNNQYAIAAYYIIAMAEAASNLSRYDGIKYQSKYNSNLIDFYHKTRSSFLGFEVKRRIMLGNYILSASCYSKYYLKAKRIKTLIYNDFQKLFEGIDIIVLPTAPTSAFNLGKKIANPFVMYLNDIFTVNANLGGLCAVSIPLGYDKYHLPIGIQLLSKPFNEKKMLELLFYIEYLIKSNMNLVK